MIAISVTAQGDLRKKLVLAFKMYDVDRNGKVDKKEMEKIIEAIYDLLGEEHRKGKFVGRYLKAANICSFR